MRKLFTIALCGLGLLALSSTTQAAPITGGILFGGVWAPTGGTGMASATGIDFSAGNPVIFGGSGSYGGLVGTGITFKNLSFNPSNAPVKPLWSFTSGGKEYSFELTEVTPTFQNGTQLGLTGKGILRADGFDDTPSDWNFTGNGFGPQFGFSTANMAVPEPATVGLLGLGLTVLTAAGSRQNRRLA